MALFNLDIHDGTIPKRGDILIFPRSQGHILSATQVKRRDPNADPRWKLAIVKEASISEAAVAHLRRSADRAGGQQVIHVEPYPKKKKLTFEQLMRGGR